MCAGRGDYGYQVQADGASEVFGKIDIFEGEGMWCKISLKDVRIIHGVLKNKGVIQ